MATFQVHSENWNAVTITSSAAVVKGVPAQLGSGQIIIPMEAVSAANGALGVKYAGLTDCPCVTVSVATIGSSGVAQGAKVYFKSNAFTTTFSSGSLVVGVAVEAGASGATTLLISFDGKMHMTNA